MKILRKSSMGLCALLTMYLIARSWFGSAYAASFSEALWTQINHLLGGQNPGLASDLELIFILAISFALSVGSLWLVFSLARRARL